MPRADWDRQTARVEAVELGDRHVDALWHDLEVAKRAGITTSSVSINTFPLRLLQNELRLWREQLSEHRSVLLFRNFPIDASGEDVALMLAGLGSHFGILAPQSSLGDVVGVVKDVGGLDYRERAYRNRLELGLHTDRCDYLGMLCLQDSAFGGISTFADGLEIEREIAKRHPDLLELLYSGFPLHRFENNDSKATVTPYRVPVISRSHGVPTICYIRAYIKLAEDEGFFQLSPSQRDALDLLDETANNASVKFTHRLLPGELALFNNCTFLHGRSGFEDSEKRMRHILRLWILDPARPSKDVIRTHKKICTVNPKAGTYYGGLGFKPTTNLDACY